MLRSRLTRIAVAGVLVVAAAFAVVSLTSSSADQPIAFNHRLHVEEVGADCTDCHLYAKSGMRATIPNLETCTSCHEERVSESEAEARLFAHVESGEPIPWRKIYWVPDDVFFSHRRHTALGQIDCEVCHGPVGAEESPVTRQVVRITMDGCMHCHEEMGATNDCIACHR